jgi:hypothetical protein
MDDWLRYSLPRKGSHLSSHFLHHGFKRRNSLLHRGLIILQSGIFFLLFLQAQL